MNLVYLQQFCKKKIKEHPRLESEIYDFYELAVTEIEEGGSEVHECSLAIQDIEELIKDQNETSD
jgi:hypothetical protein